MLGSKSPMKHMCYQGASGLPVWSLKLPSGHAHAMELSFEYRINRADRDASVNRTGTGSSYFFAMYI